MSQLPGTPMDTTPVRDDPRQPRKRRTRLPAGEVSTQPVRSRPAKRRGPSANASPRAHQAVATARARQASRAAARPARKGRS